LGGTSVALNFSSRSLTLPRRTQWQQVPRVFRSLICCTVGLPAMSFTLTNLKEDLEDLRSKFGGAPDLAFRLAT
jgi:hypothetical protein